MWLKTSLNIVLGQNPKGNNRLAFFNASINSIAYLPTVLSLRSQLTAFSFRTCSFGQLLEQEGTTKNGSRDKLAVDLLQSGELQLSWLVNGNVGSETSRGYNWRTNLWYTVDVRFHFGQINLRVVQGTKDLFGVLISNSTFRRDLWDLDLTGGSDVIVGRNFTGCIQEGPLFPLSTTRSSTGVTWGECPLADSLEDNCGKCLNTLPISR